MSSLKFGTSGLRGLVVDLEGWPSYAYATGFFRSAGRPVDPAIPVLVGRDLRESSPRLAAAVVLAAFDANLDPIDCGPLPTPALALHARTLGAPAVMVTGSHIPDDRNGLKFYKAGDEIDKDDEAAILAAVPPLRTGAFRGGGTGPRDADGGLATRRYGDRYRGAFPPRRVGRAAHRRLPAEYGNPGTCCRRSWPASARP